MGSLLTLYHRLTSSAFSPADLSGGALWLDATVGVEDTSGSVTQWNDKFGTGVDMVQAVGGDQPTTGIATINGLNAVDFNNNDMTSSTTFGAMDGQTVFYVSTTGADSGSVQKLYNFGSFPTEYLLEMPANGGDLVSKIGGGFSSTYAYWTTSPRVGAVRWSITDDTFEAFENGVEVASSTDLGSAIPMAAGKTLFLGSANGSAQQLSTTAIGEFLIYDRKLTDTEMAQVTTYLQNKWGLL